VRAVEPEMTSVSVRAESELTKLIFDRIAARLKARGSPTP
jgi:hypothetical protein